MQFALFYVDGDIDAYRGRIDEVDPVRWCELTPIKENEFYSCVCQKYTE